ncbi:hypothetical protein BIV57_11350 [Mangrovactinospora gilvigrisea]|uniref:Uncharacterized protein n=1 Tax=Mangrovactinospora gilvigrisea TaxID=1428644 RepID=A0A1J7C745_9ACTN|nr:hypothetical protein [Mangrovactinospora gilvigrisea]OIV37376.1 hypothetical protein BIV57_11350 [Mangrovactinospora gilvigrisea]
MIESDGHAHGEASYEAVSDAQPVVYISLCAGELAVLDGLVRCGECEARRDWLVLRFREWIYVRCRCGHEWHEPRLSPFDIITQCKSPERDWSDADSTDRALGFDGLFHGSYLD